MSFISDFLTRTGKKQETICDIKETVRLAIRILVNFIDLLMYVIEVKIFDI